MRSTVASPSLSRAPITAKRGPVFSSVETSAGWVEGFDNSGIKHFRGIPYADTTAGLNRYMAPRHHLGWSGVRDCSGFGPISPQQPIGLDIEYAMLVYFDRIIGEGRMGADCLNLSVWTLGVDDGGRWPVLVNFHGGGWGQGSGNGTMYDGAQLSRFGNVVVLSINAYGEGNYVSCAALVCAIIDHVPPVFGMTDIASVANNYAGSKSFKESMQHLDKSMRRIGDAQLHTRIRQKESLPTSTQVDVRREMHVLLGEVVRIG